MKRLPRRSFISSVSASLGGLALTRLIPVSKVIAAPGPHQQDPIQKPSAGDCWLDVCAPFLVEAPESGIRSEIFLTSDTFVGRTGYTDGADATEYQIHLYDAAGNPIAQNGVAKQFVVPASVLNEDKDGTDEVFFRARFVDRDCGSRGFRTSTWSRATSDRTVPVLAQRKALRRTRFTSAAPLRCGEFTDTGPRPNVRGRSGPHHSIRRPACRHESQPVRHSTVTVYPHGEVHGVA